VAVVIAGALIILFCIEHIIAILTGKEVIPSWH
jgi:TRAP-type C4-dicarboxylate transport system permease small subunit